MREIWPTFYGTIIMTKQSLFSAPTCGDNFIQFADHLLELIGVFSAHILHFTWIIWQMIQPVKPVFISALFTADFCLGLSFGFHAYEFPVAQSQAEIDAAVVLLNEVITAFCA